MRHANRLALRGIRRQARAEALCPRPEWTDAQLSRLLADLMPLARHPHELGRQLRKRHAVRKRRAERRWRTKQQLQCDACHRPVTGLYARGSRMLCLGCSQKHDGENGRVMARLVSCGLDRLSVLRTPARFVCALPV